MAIIKSFIAVCPSSEKVEEVSSKYAKLKKELVDAELAENPYSFLNLVKPKNSPDDTSIRNQMCLQNYLQLLDEEVLIKESKPAIYIYKQLINGKEKIGLLVNTSVDDYQKDVIRKHEFTIPSKEEEIIDHIDITSLMVSPVFLTYRSHENIDCLIKDCMLQIVPMFDFSTKSDNHHQIWKVDDEKTVSQFEQLFKNQVDYMYIADGHHRAGAASKYAKEQQTQNSKHTGKEPYNFFFSVLIASDAIDIIDYNRVVKDLNGHSVQAFIDKVRVFFIVEKSDGPVRPSKLHEFGMFVEGQWYRLEARKNSFNAKSDIGSLDVSILQENILSAILQIHDSRNSNRINFISGHKGVGGLEKQVNIGDGKVAFSLFPVAIEEFFTIADSGHIMPPKSTWFEPKIRTGVVMCSLGD